MNKYLKYSFLVLLLSILGFSIYFFAIKSDSHSESVHEKEVFTCSMHPQINNDKPGNCPVCGMFLIKKVTKNHKIDSKSIADLLKPTDNFIVGDYKTTTAKDSTFSSEINLPGVVVYDPNSAVNVSARISGRIEKMYVNYKYQKVNKGQKLFDLYSPELMTEQQNFIYLLTNDAENTSIIKASKHKLMLYGMTLNQINTLAAAKRMNPVISIYSPASGIIEGTEDMAKPAASSMQNPTGTTENLAIKEGDYIKKSQVVFKLLDTDKVWAVFNVLQGYTGLVKLNQSISISSELDEDESFDAKINFIETQFNSTDKSNRIRVYLNNNSMQFPIGLRLQGIIETNPIKGIWIHKQSLVSIGNKKIVFLKKDSGFKVKPIKTGIEINDFIQVLDGISVQDTIAENGQYLIDSESFIKTE